MWLTYTHTRSHKLPAKAPRANPNGNGTRSSRKEHLAFWPIQSEPLVRRGDMKRDAMRHSQSEDGLVVVILLIISEARKQRLVRTRPWLPLSAAFQLHGLTCPRAWRAGLARAAW